MGALLPFILPLLPALINGAEVAFRAPKSGTSRLNAVLQGLQAFLSQLVASRQLPDVIATPAPDAIIGVIETFLAQMRLDGTLGKPAAQPGALYLVQGTISPLKTA